MDWKGILSHSCLEWLLWCAFIWHYGRLVNKFGYSDTIWSDDMFSLEFAELLLVVTISCVIGAVSPFALVIYVVWRAKIK